MTLAEDWDVFVVQAKRSIEDVKRGVRRASWNHTVLLSMGVAMSILGLAFQVIFLNLLLASFPVQINGEPGGGPVTVLITESVAILVIYLCASAVVYARTRPSLAGLCNPSVWGHTIATGFMFACNGYLIVFSTPHTPEILQSVLLSSQIIWTFIFAVVFRINQGKNYCHGLVIVSVVLSVAGIMLAVLATSGGSNHYENPGTWALLFALGVLPGAISNVIAAHYFQNCAYDEESEKDVIPSNGNSVNDDSHVPRPAAGGAMATSSLSLEPRDSASANKSSIDTAPLMIASVAGSGNDTKGDLAGQDKSTGQAQRVNSKGYALIEIGAAKLVFLVLSSLFQLLSLGVLLPTDWAPFFGPFPNNQTAALHSIQNGVRCTFGYYPDACPSTFKYYILMALGFGMTNAGNVMVNQFSAPLCSMVCQIASPLTAIALVIFPSWSPTPMKATVWQCVVAVVFLVTGSVMYSFWEQLSAERQREEQPADGHTRASIADSYGTLET